MKRLLLIIMAVILIAFTIASCNKTNTNETTETTETTTTTGTTPSTETTSPMDNWDCKKTDLSDKKYIPTKSDPSIQAQAFGYKPDTYEYDYFRALSSISYNISIWETFVRDAFSPTTDKFFETFIETVGRENLTEPFKDVLSSAYSLLSEADFAIYNLSINDYANYLISYEYELDTCERVGGLMIYFKDTQSVLSSDASELLSLKEKYKDYSGEFALSDKEISYAKALTEACNTISEKSNKLREEWRTYFYEKSPSAKITNEELIPELNVVKVTVSGDAEIIFPSADSLYNYIENFKYKMVYNERMGKEVVAMEKMQCPVTLYLPVGYYHWALNYKSISIDKYDSDGREYEDKLQFSFDPSQYYSTEPLKMNGEFFDFALRKIFGENYSERDLLRVDYLHIYNGGIDKLSGKYEDPYIVIEERGKSVTYVYYSEFTDKEEKLEYWDGIEEDLLHFKGGVRTSNMGERFNELREKIAEYHVTKDIG